MRRTSAVFMAVMLIASMAMGQSPQKYKLDPRTHSPAVPHFNPPLRELPREGFLRLSAMRATVPVENRWSIGYYPYWWGGSSAAEDKVKATSWTHVILFNASPQGSSPYIGGFSSITGTGKSAAIVTKMHAAGRKVILSVGGIYGSEASQMLAVANSAANSAVFAKTASDWAFDNGIDGLEMDWEFPLASARVQWNRLNRLIRNELDTWPSRGRPRGVYICAAYARTGGATDSYFAYQKDSMVVYFDQINAMTYTMWQGNDQAYRSGFDTPVNPPSTTTYPGYNGYSLAAQGPLSYVAYGYPASLIGVAMSFEGTRFSGVTRMGQSYSAWAFCSTVSRSGGSGYASIPASTRTYDPDAKAAWCVSGSTVYSFLTPQSASDIAAWALNNGFGGLMVYDFPAGYDVGAANPYAIEDAAISTFMGGAVPPPPPPPPVKATGTLTPTTVSLPAGGGTVNYTWTSQNAASVTFRGQAVALSGTQAVQMTQSGTNVLVTSGPGGSSTYTSVVTVAAAPPPPPVSDCDTAFQRGVRSVDTTKAYMHGFDAGFPGGFASGVASVICPPAVHDTLFVPVALTYDDSVRVALRVLEKSFKK